VGCRARARLAAAVGEALPGRFTKDPDPAIRI